MILILFSGGKDSQKLLEDAMIHRTKYVALQFYSTAIPKINAINVHNVFVLGASDTTENADELLKQNNTYLYTAIAYAKAIGAREIQTGLVDEDFEEPFLRDWLPMYISNAKYIAKRNLIELTAPLLKKIIV